MSVAIRTKRLINPSSTKSASSPLTMPSVPTMNVAEAPEREQVAREAPETRPGRCAEAPDAGEGRSSYSEHEFTHGRSQS